MSKFTVKKDEGNNVWQVWEGDTVVSVFETRKQARDAAASMNTEVEATTPEVTTPDHGASITSSGHLQGPVVGVEKGGVLLVNGDRFQLADRAQATAARDALLAGTTTIDQVRAAAELVATERAATPSSDRIERMKLAKSEAADLKAWRKGGEQGPRPATPNLDAVEAKAPTAPTTKKAAAAKPEPTPVPEGFVAIPIRGRAALAVVEALTVPQGVKVDKDQMRVLLASDADVKAQLLVDRFRAAEQEAKQYQSRILEHLIGVTRSAFPKVKDPVRSSHSRAVDALNHSRKSWTAVAREADGFPMYQLGKGEPMTANQVLKELPEPKTAAA